MKSVVIPVDLDTESGLKAFLQAISKPDYVSQVDESKLPTEAAALVSLIKDRDLMDRFKSLGEKIVQQQNAAISGVQPLTTNVVSPMKIEAETLRSELLQKHPQAVELLKQFTEYQEAKEIMRVRGLAPMGLPYAIADVVAVAEVYANVAVATNFAVAAAVLVVIGAVVI